jgi:hypothetical protein
MIAKKSYKEELMKINYSYLLAALSLPFTSTLAQELPLTPPDAKPGECYARVVQPAQYEDVEEKVLVKEASEEITIVPAVYESVEKEVEVVPETTKLIPVPAVYEKVKEKIEIRPELRIWKTSLRKKALPVNPAILAAIKASGIDLDQAKAGECFREYYRPLAFKTVTEEVVVKAESNDTEVIPPQFEEIEKTVVVKPASKEIVEVPAVYEEVEEKVLIEPERTVWKKGQNPAQKVSGATGEIMCLVKVPAKYKMIKKRVLKSPATTKVVEIPEETEVVKAKKLVADTHIEYTPVPAKYVTVEKKMIDTNATFAWYSSRDEVEKTLKYTGHQICLTVEPAKTKEITKSVMVTPPSIKEEKEPAVNEVVTTQKLIAEAKTVKTPIEAEYKVMKKRKKLSDTHMEWQRILCQTNMTEEIIAKLQSALNEKGYKAGKADGILGRGTRRALEQFQRDHALATGGITYETLNALGITL